MILRRSDEHTKILRQNIVSKARLRGLNIEQISSLLEEEGVVNPNTELPYSLSTISKDMREIQERWKDDMLASISDHRARVLAELGQVKAAAWGAGKLATVLKAIRQESDLLGLDELDRMGTEIALAQLLKGLPPDIASGLKKVLATKMSDKKRIENKGQKVIDITATRSKRNRR